MTSCYQILSYYYIFESHTRLETIQFDVVTMRIRYRVNGVSDLTNKVTQADITTQGKMSAYYSDVRSKH